MDARDARPEASVAGRLNGTPRRADIGVTLCVATICFGLGVVAVLPVLELGQAIQEQSGHDRDEDHRANLEQQRLAHRVLRSPVRSKAPIDWIDGTQIPTKIPAVLSAATKYRYTDNKNDANAAANSTSFTIA
jgi:hypothetical protein